MELETKPAARTLALNDQAELYRQMGEKTCRDGQSPVASRAAVHEARAHAARIAEILEHEWLHPENEAAKPEIRSA